MLAGVGLPAALNREFLNTPAKGNPMNSMSFLMKETSQGQSYTEVTAHYSIAQHTEMEVRMNVQPAQLGGKELAIVQAELWEKAAEEMQDFAKLLRRGAAQTTPAES
jgi:hypothetical protein